MYNSLADFSSDLAYPYTGFGDPGTADGNYNLLLQGGNYNYGLPSYNALSFGGLTAGETYQVQLWAEDLRIYGLRQESFSAHGQTGDSSGLLTYPDNGSGDSVLGQYVIGTFVADAPTEQIDASGYVVQLNLFQLRDLGPAMVPEPGAYGVLAGAAVLLAALGRRPMRGVA
jgi:hypothetical protein